MAYKKYGVKGLLEYHAVFRVGGASVHVPFTGGTLTGYGVAPATYATSDAFLQYAIEHSPEFNQGKIVLLHTSSDQDPSTSKETSFQEKKEEQQRIEKQDTIPANLEQVEVDNVADAKQYLIEHFNAKPSSLRSKKEVKEVGLSHGIAFIGF